MSQENLSLRFQGRSDTFRAVPLKMMVRGLKFSDLGSRGIVLSIILCKENKSADQLGGFLAADLRLCFRISKKHAVSCRGSTNVSISKWHFLSDISSYLT